MLEREYLNIRLAEPSSVAVPTSLFPMLNNKLGIENVQVESGQATPRLSSPMPLDVVIMRQPAGHDRQLDSVYYRMRD